MTQSDLISRFRSLAAVELSRPGGGMTVERHRAIYAAGREDLSLAKLIEAHWDAVAILEEAGRHPERDVTYAVWASEVPGKPLQLAEGKLTGTKEFCSGAGLVDRALITAGSSLVEVDLHSVQSAVKVDGSGWCTDAFRMTQTAAVTFDGAAIVSSVGEDDWYTQRVGFWQGACGPAAAWAGGAAGLLDYASGAKREDSHTLAHLGAMYADIEAMTALLDAVADRFDHAPRANAKTDALATRHTVEQLCTDVLQRFGRAFGPAPYVKSTEIGRRCAELDLFLRQSHAERDLEALGRAIRRRD